MKNLLIKIEYEGTAYKGWQTQPKQVTVEGTIKSVFERICQAPVRIRGVSRTDSGVHARGQVANLDIPKHIPLRKLFFSANALLPDDIAIIDLIEVSDTYNARFQSFGKRYIYQILNSPIPRALGRQTTLWVKRPLDIARIQTACPFFEGTHDFAAFQGKGCQQPNTVKTISRVACRQQTTGRFTDVHLTVEGSGFLKNMIRIIVGTLLEIGYGKQDPALIETAFSSRNRSDAGTTAPANGLILEEIFLKEDPFVERPFETWDT